MKSLFVTLALLMGVGVTGCGHSAPYYDTLCVDPLTQIRVDYSYCAAHPNWVYYVHPGYSYPGYGGHITNYTVNNYNRPANANIHTGSLPSTAGKASKYNSGNTRVKPSSQPKPASTKGGSKPQKQPARPKPPAKKRP